MPGRRRQIVAGEHRLANSAEMAEPLDDAVERELRDLGARVLDQHKTRFCRADLGDGSGDRRRQILAARYGKLRLGGM